MASSSQGGRQSVSLADLLPPPPKKRSFFRNRGADGTFGGVSKEEESSSPATSLALSPNSKKKRKKETDKDLRQSTQSYGGRHTPYPIQVGSDQYITVMQHPAFNPEEDHSVEDHTTDPPQSESWNFQANLSDNDLLDFNMFPSQPEADTSASLNDDANFYRRSPSPREMYPEIHHIAEDGTPISDHQAARKKLSESWRKLFDDPKKLFITAFLEAEADMYHRRATAPAAAPCQCGERKFGSVTVDVVTLTGTLEPIMVSFCKVKNCSDVATAIMRHGLFPASPSQPRVAFGIDVLQFYLRSGAIHKSPVHSFSYALALYNEDHGTPITQQRPYFEQLKSCIPWFDALLRRVELHVDSIVDSQPESTEYRPIPPSQPDEWPSPHKGVAGAYLVRRCTACFGRHTWGGDPERCADVIVCFDGNFQHRLYQHMREDPELLSAGDAFGWITPEELDDAEKHLEDCRAANVPSTKKRRAGDVPPQVLDACEESYKAATEKLTGLDKSVYSSKGIMAVVCNHDVPLFLADIRTLGEPRYLAIALLRKLASLLPEQATIGVMYDIADQLERTILSNNVMPELSDRLAFAVALFHAFGHRIQCQVVYNPRYRPGFGLANGEGNERVWSLCRDVIGPQRVMGPHRRKLTLSRKMEYIANSKAASYPTYVQSMVTRMEDKWKDSQKTIAAIKRFDNLDWDRKRLLEEWEIKKKHHLSAKEYSETQLTSQIRSLLEAARNASGMTNALKRVQNELDHEEYSMTLFPDRPTEIQDLREYVVRVGELHNESLQHLDHLTERIGLTQIEVPDHLSERDRKYLKLLINLQVQKHNLWTSLQAYQDEHGPVAKASSHGGRSANLGTTKLATASTALKQKSKVVLNVVSKFNSTVTALRQVVKPSWVPEGLVPRTLAGDKILRLDQTDEEWEETFGGTPMMEAIHDPEATGRIPAYARSREVRLGIIAALQMDRIEEQERRLETERVNVINTWVQQLIQVWECRKAHVTDMPWICHRLDKYISQLVRQRPLSPERKPLWVTPINQLLPLLLQFHPSTLCNIGSSLSSPIFSFPVTGTAEPVTGSNAIVPRRDVNVPSELQVLEEADAQDLALLEKEYRNIYKGLEQLAVEENQAVTGPLPPVRDLIGQIDGRQPASALSRAENLSIGNLPPLAMLIDATTGRSTGSEPVFNFVSEATRATLRGPYDRVTLDATSRFYGTVEIDANEQKTLDEGRHISAKLVPILCRLLKDSIEQKAVARAAAPSLRVRCSLGVAISPDTSALALEKAVTEAGDASLWLVPLQFKTQTTKWGLLTFNIQARTVQHSCGGRFDEKDKRLIVTTAEVLGRLHDERHNPECSRRWGIVDLTAYGREKLPNQSVLWLCEDLKHRLLGLRVPPTIENLSAVRNYLRDLVQELPHEPEMELVTGDDHLNVSESVREGLHMIQNL